MYSEYETKKLALKTHLETIIFENLRKYIDKRRLSELNFGNQPH